MWVLGFAQAETGAASRWSAPGNCHKGATEIAPLLIVRDESHRLSLGGLLSSRAHLRFAGCVQFAMKVYGRSTNFQRTAKSVLTVCVRPGDKRNQCRTDQAILDETQHEEGATQMKRGFSEDRFAGQA